MRQTFPDMEPAATSNRHVKKWPELLIKLRKEEGGKNGNSSCAQKKKKQTNKPRKHLLTKRVTDNVTCHSVF